MINYILYFQRFSPTLCVDLLRLDEEAASKSTQELFQEINEYSKMMQTSDFKNLSGRERRRINSLIRDKQKRLDQLLISQGIQSLKDANRF